MVATLSHVVATLVLHRDVCIDRRALALWPRAAMRSATLHRCLTDVNDSVEIFIDKSYTIAETWWMEADTHSVEPRHPIRVVARRTGLTAATLRAWERRHGAVHPARSATERRLYTDADIERLRLMRDLSAQGHAVAQLSRMPTPDLATLARQERAATARSDTDQSTGTPIGEQASGSEIRDAIHRTVSGCESAIRSLDGAEVHRLLVRALVELGPMRFIDDVAEPVCHRVGQLWQEGSVGVAHEHVASVAVRETLGFLLDTLRTGQADGPHLLATTPPGERHEFGAMMAAVVAAMSGARVTYLGPDLPASDIAAAARQVGAHFLALSIVGAHDPDRLASDLRHLRHALGPEVQIIAGGSAAPLHADALDAVGARCLDLAGLRSVVKDAQR